MAVIIDIMILLCGYSMQILIALNIVLVSSPQSRRDVVSWHNGNLRLPLQINLCPLGTCFTHFTQNRAQKHFSLLYCLPVPIHKGTVYQATLVSPPRVTRERSTCSVWASGQTLVLSSSPWDSDSCGSVFQSTRTQVYFVSSNQL